MFSEKCSSEETLGKMESLQGSQDEKKATPSSAVYTAISSQSQELENVSYSTIQFSRNKMISERIIIEYGKRAINL